MNQTTNGMLESWSPGVMQRSNCPTPQQSVTPVFSLNHWKDNLPYTIARHIGSACLGSAEEDRGADSNVDGERDH